MNLSFEFNPAGVDWEELESLFRLVKRDRLGDELRRAFVNSSLVCFVFDETTLVGAARALSDFTDSATICDVVIHPQYQQRGLGSRLMTELMSRLPVKRTLVACDRENREFFERLGFTELGHVLARSQRDRDQAEG